MTGTPTYDDSDASAHTPMSAEDVDALLVSDGSTFAGNPARVRHLLTRVRASFMAHRRQIRALQRDVERIKDDSRRNADPVAGALEALGNLDDDSAGQVYDLRGRQMVAGVRTAREDAERVRVAALSDLNRARFAIGKVMVTPGMPAEVTEALDRALRTVQPDEQAVVSAEVDWAPEPEVSGGFASTGSLSGELFDD